MKSLNKILASFDLPQHRKNKKTLHNLKWLLRNIDVKNSEHPKIEEAKTLIMEMIKNG